MAPNPVPPPPPPLSLLPAATPLCRRQQQQQQQQRRRKNRNLLGLSFIMQFITTLTHPHHHCQPCHNHNKLVIVMKFFLLVLRCEAYHYYLFYVLNAMF
jgi:hypothetical protein